MPRASKSSRVGAAIFGASDGKELVVAMASPDPEVLSLAVVDSVSAETRAWLVDVAVDSGLVGKAGAIPLRDPSAAALLEGEAVIGATAGACRQMTYATSSRLMTSSMPSSRTHVGRARRAGLRPTTNIAG